MAERDGEVVGHILFTPVTVESPVNIWTAMALGPMAVTPGCQRSGIGSQLVQAGLETCRAAGNAVVFVLGHPEYYPRFGFVPAARYQIRCEWDVPEDVFMVAELQRGAIANRSGTVKYHPAFHDVS